MAGQNFTATFFLDQKSCLPEAWVIQLCCRRGQQFPRKPREPPLTLSPPYPSELRSSEQVATIKNSRVEVIRG